MTFAEIDRDLSAAVATAEDVPAELREVAEKVISLREGVGVYATPSRSKFYGSKDTSPPPVASVVLAIFLHEWTMRNSTKTRTLATCAKQSRRT